MVSMSTDKASSSVPINYEHHQTHIFTGFLNRYVVSMLSPNAFK